MSVRRNTGSFSPADRYAFGFFKPGAWLWQTISERKTAKRIKVITSTIEQVLMETNAPKYIEYVSLDIEGAELEALKAFPFNEYKVGAWTIEHNFQEPRRSQILELLKQHGYRRVRSVKWDDWYLSHDLVAQKKRGGFVSP